MTSPKQQILSNPGAAATHAAWVSDSKFLHYAELALLQMIRDAGTPLEQAATTVNAYRLQGAQLFIRALEGLSEPEKPRSMKNPDSLPHHDV